MGATATKQLERSRKTRGAGTSGPRPRAHRLGVCPAAGSVQTGPQRQSLCGGARAQERPTAQERPSAVQEAKSGAGRRRHRPLGRAVEAAALGPEPRSEPPAPRGDRGHGDTVTGTGMGMGTATGTGTRRTFGDALPPAPRVAGDAAAAEAGGEVPAGRVHGALVSAVGARRARVRVVAENCSEKAERAPRERAAGSGPGRRGPGSHALGQPGGGTRCLQLPKWGGGSIAQTAAANGAQRGLGNHRGELPRNDVTQRAQDPCIRAA